jgi:regulator of replication initiation timing
MKTIEQILKPYLMPNDEYGGYDVGSHDAANAMREYAEQQTRETTEQLLLWKKNAEHMAQENERLREERDKLQKELDDFVKWLKGHNKKLSNLDKSMGISVQEFKPIVGKLKNLSND